MADFVGASNLLDGELVDRTGDFCTIRLPNGDIVRAPKPSTNLANGAVTLAIRPERIELQPSGSQAANRVDGNVVASSYLGARCLVVVEIGTQQIRVEATVRPTGNKVSMRFPDQALRVFPRHEPDELDAA